MRLLIFALVLAISYAQTGTRSSTPTYSREQPGGKGHWQEDPQSTYPNYSQGHPGGKGRGIQGGKGRGVDSQSASLYTGYSQQSNGGVQKGDTGAIDACPTQFRLSASCTQKGLNCEYGKECCCGVCSPSIIATCNGDEWQGMYTDACMDKSACQTDQHCPTHTPNCKVEGEPCGVNIGYCRNGLYCTGEGYLYSDGTGTCTRHQTDPSQPYGQQQQYPQQQPYSYYSQNGPGLPLWMVAGLASGSDFAKDAADAMTKSMAAGYGNPYSGYGEPYYGGNYGGAYGNSYQPYNGLHFVPVPINS